MNNTERLIGKMNDELAAFVAGLERLPVQDVIEKAGEIAVKTDMALLSQTPDRGVPKRASDGMNLFVGDDVTQWVIRKALYTSSRRNRLSRS